MKGVLILSWSVKVLHFDREYDAENEEKNENKRLSLPVIADLSSYVCEDENEWFEKIDITNDYMFAHVMRDPDICTELLKYLLPEHNISRIEYISTEENDDKSNNKDSINTLREESKITQIVNDTQKTVSPFFSKRGVRFDAYLDDGKTVYDIEMQAVSHKYIPQRVRLYQSHIDVNQLSKGEAFKQLRPSYIIFLCKFDPFRMGFYKYTFRNRCDEDNRLTLDDGTHKLFFNTAGHKGNISPKLKELLKYMNNTADYDTNNTDVELIKKIEETVRKTKENERMENDMLMALKYKLDMWEARDEGEERGIAIAEERARQEKTEMVIKMLKSRISLKKISEFTGLPVSEIKDIKQNMNIE